MDINAYIESGVIESYVLGMADSQEAAELEQLAQQYPAVRQAIDAFEASLEKASFDGAVAPPPSVKEQLMFTLKDEFAKEEDRKVIPIIPIGKTAGTDLPARREGGWVKFIAAAAVILLVTSAALNVYLYRKVDDAETRYAVLLKQNATITADNGIYQTRMLDMYNSMQLMTDPAMVKVVMPGQNANKNDLATVFWDSKSKDVYLLANKLPQAPEGKQYQLWALVDGVPVDAGVIDACNGLCKLKNIPKAQAFAITLEQKGGSPAPHLDQLHVMGKVG